jgi:hypothetical protein
MAPDAVSFLRSPHRHVFHVEVKAIVGHADRQVEFFILQRLVDTFIQTQLLAELTANQSLSCEDMASRILDFLRVSEKVDAFEVTVSEDGENDGVASIAGFHSQEALGAIINVLNDIQKRMDADGEGAEDVKTLVRRLNGRFSHVLLSLSLGSAYEASKNQ